MLKQFFLRKTEIQYFIYKLCIPYIVFVYHKL